MAIPLTTTTKPVPKAPPTRERLELHLANGLVDPVRDMIDGYKLPYRIVISDGTLEHNGQVVPTGVPVLKDTLSAGELHLNAFITEDPDTLEMKQDAAKMAVSDHEVLIIGDTGTGKEIIAKAMIGKREGHIKALNCAAMPAELIESDLFGHTAGAFTSALKEKQGLMQAAKDGVLFLDEVGELPLPVQAKLLRALQEKRVRKVGATTDESINCKFVCATNRNLKKMVEAGTFRKDLYARISTLELHIKPLKERECDIVPITLSLKGGDKFLEKHKEDLLGGMLELPYNVRSLQQYVVRFTVLGKVVLSK